MYTENELVGIAKRENNNKRKYLVVNKLQGKHVPVSGRTAFNMFDKLAEKVRAAYNDEKLLLIGFAETATAIGARLAVCLDSYYMQTTREVIDNVEYLFFTESHSHATEQKLVKNDVDSVIDKISRIVFVEDEVTTGSTILKIIDIIERLYPNKVSFSVASLLNGMDKNAMNIYNNRNISVHYLVKTNHSEYTAIAEGVAGDGEYAAENTDEASVEEYRLNGYINARRLCVGSEYNKACESLWTKIEKICNFNSTEKVLVIGTEEFMYPSLYTASRIEDKVGCVFCHSTTRSPIEVSREDNYPLHRRFELSSLYDDNRRTYIYDIGEYDTVIIITDSPNNSYKGLNTLVNAVKSSGNENIKLFRWC